jgi:hypothetical protein
MRHLIALLSIFTFLTSSTLHAQPPSYVPTDGLVGWWPFNSNANDESGNGNNGVVNGATLSTDRFGNSNSTYDFNGTSDFINIIDNPSMHNQSFSISTWLYGTNYNGFRQILSKSYGTSVNESINLLVNNLPIWNVTAQVGGAGYYGTLLQSPNMISENNWHLMCYIYRGIGQTQELYIDGVIVASNIASTGAQYDSNPLTFGAQLENNIISYFFKGKLDDIGIWNRALTPAEIQALYTGQGSSPCVSPTAVSFTGLATSYTTSAGPVTLAGTPASGVFIGPGITGSTFSPAVAGEGTHGITYMYEDEQGCLNAASLCTSVSLGMGLEPGGNAPGGVRVFPNPNRGQFTVELELAGLVGLQVFDARGALVHNEVFTASGSRTQRTLDLSAFAKGSYTLLVEHNGQRVTQAVVVE